MMDQSRESAAFRAAVAAARNAPPAGLASSWSLMERETGVKLVADLELALRFWPRFRGWMCRRPAPSSNALLLAPCHSVHTLWMRFPIDLVFVDEHGRVVDIVHRLPPWRTYRGPKNAYAAIEAVADGPLAGIRATASVALIATDT